MAYLACVRQELVEFDRHRLAEDVAISSPVDAIDQVTCLLKFSGQEKRCRDFRAPALVAGGAGATRAAGVKADVPETPTCFIGIAIEEVFVLLPDEEICVIDSPAPWQSDERVLYATDKGRIARVIEQMHIPCVFGVDTTLEFNCL